MVPPAPPPLRIHKYDMQNNALQHQIVYCLLSWKALELTSCVSGVREDPGICKWKEDVSQTESLSGNPEDGLPCTLPPSLIHRSTLGKERLVVLRIQRRISQRHLCSLRPVVLCSVKGGSCDSVKREPAVLGENPSGAGT